MGYEAMRGTGGASRSFFFLKTFVKCWDRSQVSDLLCTDLSNLLQVYSLVLQQLYNQICDRGVGDHASCTVFTRYGATWFP